MKENRRLQMLPIAETIGVFLQRPDNELERRRFAITPLQIGQE